MFGSQTEENMSMRDVRLNTHHNTKTTHDVGIKQEVIYDTTGCYYMPMQSLYSTGKQYPLFLVLAKKSLIYVVDISDA